MINGDSLEAFVEGLKAVYASMFTYRAYSIRRAWGLREENLRMPVIVEGHLDDLAYTTNIRVTKAPNTQGLKVEIDGVLGEQSHATNPTGASETFSFEFYSHPNHEVFSSDPNVPSNRRQISTSILKMLNKLYPDFEDHLSNMKVNAEAIELELAGMNVMYKPEPHPVLLQYKHRYSADTVVSVLNGEIDRAELDQLASEASATSNFGELNRAVLTKPLSGFTFTRETPKTRYALIYIEGEYQIITWNHVVHFDMKTSIERTFPDVVWITSGYMKINEDNRFLELYASPIDNTDPRPEDLPFVTTSDGDQTRINLEAAFESAMINATKGMLDFLEVIGQVRGASISSSLGNQSISTERLFKLVAEQRDQANP